MDALCGLVIQVSMRILNRVLTTKSVLKTTFKSLKPYKMLLPLHTGISH